MSELSLPEPIGSWRDRWSGLADGVVVLDLGEQPASDLFPGVDDPLPDPRYRLRMVMSTTSSLLQLEEDDTTPEPPIGNPPTEPPVELNSLSVLAPEFTIHALPLLSMAMPIGVLSPLPIYPLAPEIAVSCWLNSLTALAERWA